jgi:IS605 OrfB family transposase
VNIIRSSQTSLTFTNKGKLETLHEVMDEYARVTTVFIELFWLNDFEIKDLTKAITRIPESWFSARMRQNAAREALSLCKAAEAKALELNESPIKPTHTGKRMILSSQIAKIEAGRGSFDLVVTLGSIGNRLKIVLPLKSHYHMNQFTDWERSTSLTVFRDRIQFSYKKSIDKIDRKKALGVDIGINKLLVTSDGKQYGKDIKTLIAKIRRKRFKSKAYYRAKSELKATINRTVKQMFAEHEDIGVFVFEDIKGMKQNGKKRKNRSASFRKVLHNWNYRMLLDYAKSQTEVRRSRYRSVNPYKTSQTCPVCSHVEKGNRVNEQFACVSCGYSQDADHVGSINIVTRFTTGQYGASFKAVRIL